MADGSPTPIATRAELFEMLAPFNVSPETPSPKERVLYGPGIRIELGEDDPVMQFLMYEVDTDISILTDLDTLTSRHLYRGAEDDEG